MYVHMRTFKLNVGIAVILIFALVVPLPDTDTALLIGLVAHNRPIGFRHILTSIRARESYSKNIIAKTIDITRVICYNM